MNLNRDRLTRAARSPLKAVLPLAMRRLGIIKPVELQVGKNVFHGLLPEAITTNIWRSGSHDLATTSMIESLLRPGQHFVDVGSHFGYFSLIASDVVGEQGSILAIEAMPETFAYLSRNTAQLVANTRLVQAAAWDCEESLNFMDVGIVSSSLNSAFELRGKALTKQTPSSTEVRAQTVDGILAGTSVDGIKIDAESSELKVLKGLSTTLANSQPWLVIELGDGLEDGQEPASTSIAELLSKFGLHPHVLRNGQFEPVSLPKRVEYMNVAFLADKHIQL